MPKEYGYPTYKAVSDDGEEMVLKIQRQSSRLSGLFFFVTKGVDGMEEPISGNVLGTVEGARLTIQFRDPYEPDQSIQDAEGEFLANGDLRVELPDDPSTTDDESEVVTFERQPEPQTAKSGPRTGLGYAIQLPIIDGTIYGSYLSANVDGNGTPMINGGGAVNFDPVGPNLFSGWTFLLGEWRCVHVHHTRLTDGDWVLADHVATYWFKADYTDVQGKYLGKAQPLHGDSAWKAPKGWRKLDGAIGGDGYYTRAKWLFRPKS